LTNRIENITKQKPKKVGILQSNYLPWRGYFHLISKVDLFIFHDDLQYTKNDWRNRNVIKTPNGIQWITIPCGTNEKRLISEVEIKDSSWQKKHWNLIKSNYQKAPYFNFYKSFFEDFYLDKKWTNLSELNQFLIKEIAINYLNISTTVFDDSKNHELTLFKGNRVIELLKKVNATHYISGPAAKNYISESTFKKNEIKIDWMNYNNYLEYDQLHGHFQEKTSIIDLLFNLGEKSKNYLENEK